MTRLAEAAGARWDEIDLDTKIWTIPPERMKKRREHRISLTEQALALLEAMQTISGHLDMYSLHIEIPKSHVTAKQQTWH